MQLLRSNSLLTDGKELLSHCQCKLTMHVVQSSFFWIKVCKRCHAHQDRQLTSMIYGIKSDDDTHFVLHRCPFIQILSVLHNINVVSKPGWDSIAKTQIEIEIVSTAMLSIQSFKTQLVGALLYYNTTLLITMLLLLPALFFGNGNGSCAFTHNMREQNSNTSHTIFISRVIHRFTE